MLPLLTLQKEQMDLYRIVGEMGGSFQALGQTYGKQAQVSVWERRIKERQREFGLTVYGIMESNLTLSGEVNGGEHDKGVAKVFRRCFHDIRRLTNDKGQLQSELVRLSRPTALCSHVATKGIRVPTRNIHSRESTSNDSWWSKARNTLERSTAPSRIQKDMNAIDESILQRKEDFGPEMYAAMTKDRNFVPHDPLVAELLRALKGDIAIPLAKVKKMRKDIEAVWSTCSGRVSLEEVREFVMDNSSLWARLELNTGIDPSRAITVAFLTLLRLSSGDHFVGNIEDHESISVYQLERFQKSYMENPKGSQEFFHRCIFSIFDRDEDGVLDPKEREAFLQAFFLADKEERSPEEQDQLRSAVLSKVFVDPNDQDQEFALKEVQSLLSGADVMEEASK